VFLFAYPLSLHFKEVFNKVYSNTLKIEQDGLVVVLVGDKPEQCEVR
jgi:hypothetical protein